MQGALSRVVFDMKGAMHESCIAPNRNNSCASVEKVVNIDLLKQEVAMSPVRNTFLTHARALELFDYDAITGNLIWKTRTSNVVKVGDEVGCVRANGRVYTTVDGENYMVHRLVWLWHKGEFPQHHLAPIDGDYLNTRIENLVEQTPKETVKKSGPRSNNQVGVKGVSWDEEKQQYSVYAYIDGKSVLHSRHRTLATATVAAEEALRGIIPTSEQRLANRLDRVTEKRLWRGMLKWSRGLHRWESIEHFLDTITQQPRADAFLVRVDENQPTGPDNFRWSEVDEDHRSPAARQKAAEREKNWGEYRRRHLRKYDGLTPEQFAEKLREQNGVCAICKRPETAIDRGRVRELSVDHNHSTGIVRSLLCFRCNTVIGKMEENEILFQAAADYLRQWQMIDVQSENVVKLKRE